MMVTPFPCEAHVETPRCPAGEAKAAHRDGGIRPPPTAEQGDTIGPDLDQVLCDASFIPYQDSAKAVCLGVLVLQLAFAAWCHTAIPVYSPMLMALSGFGIVYLGTVQLLLPPRFHCSVVHSRFDIAGAVIILGGVVAVVGYYLWAVVL